METTSVLLDEGLDAPSTTIPTAVVRSGAVGGGVTPAVEVVGVTRRFGKHVAVDNVSIEVNSGEFVCLLGPSGCGKTTLLRILGGFETADVGRIRLLGKDVTQDPPHRRRTNMVFQHHALFPHMDVFENVAFGLRMRGVPAKDIPQKVSRALGMVRMDDFARRKVDQLSGGQRQRVAIARAIVNEPAVLLLDEPLGALDMRLRLEVQDELRRLQRSLGSPFIFVTHDQAEAMSIADRLVVMKDGRVEQIGTPAEIYGRPNSLFVATFVGNSNLLPGLVDRVLPDGAIVNVCGSNIGCRTVSPIRAGQKVLVALRHEDIKLAKPGPESFPGAISGTLLDRIFQGPTIRLSVGLDSDAVIWAELPATSPMAHHEVGRAIAVDLREANGSAFPLADAPSNTSIAQIS